MDKAQDLSACVLISMKARIQVFSATEGQRMACRNCLHLALNDNGV